jgi:hypothetical protein
MRAQKFWIEIVLVGTAIACAIALLIATLGTAANAVNGNNTPQEQISPLRTEQAEQAYEGMITCSLCGAKHPAASDQGASTCVRRCVHGGESFVLVGSDSTYLLDGDLSVLKKFAGQRARVTGLIRGRTIRVSSAEAGS